MSLRIRTLDTFDDTDDALRAYYGAEYAAFGWPVDDAHLRVKRDLVTPERYLLAEWDDEPVGGTGSYPLELTLPGGTRVPAAGVSDVGVAPSHRRRGIVSALMRAQLRSLAESGEPVAVLHSSEAGIYRRFGYGPCTRWRQVRIDARRVGFRDDFPEVGGSLQILQRSDSLQICAAVHETARLNTNGGLSRPESWLPVVLGDTDVYLGGTADHLVMVHRDGSGRADGYAIYKVDHDWSRGQADHELQVWELVGESRQVELALWRTLANHDLVSLVTGPIAVDHPLFDVVVDGRQVGTVWEQDLLWARPLDVERLLSTRRYGSAGRIVIAVDDPLMPQLGGRFLLEVDDHGVGSCTRTDLEEHARVGVSDLGRVLLGGCSFRRLSAAGQALISHPGTATGLDRMFGVDPLPWSWVRF